MKFLKNKIRFVFWAILVSLSIGMTNIWAAAAASQLATPMGKSKKQGPPVVPQSAQKATIQITNYCRGIIEALNNKDSKGEPLGLDDDKQKFDKVLELFNSFYKKIPSTLKNSNRHRATKHKTDLDFELALRNDALNYHKSLFLCLAMCLKMSVSDASEDIKVAELKELVKCEAKTISLNVKAVGGKSYLIKFEISEQPVASDSSDQGGDIHYQILVKISIQSSAADQSNAIDISGGYKTGNFFKNTTTALVPTSTDSDSEILRGAGGPSFDLPAAVATPAAAAAAAAVDASTPAINIANKLNVIFNAIPKDYRVHLEQYAQFIIYSLVKFMGSCICDAEYITGDGRADLIIRTERDGKTSGSIIELKRDNNGTAEEAIKQIKRNGYVNSFDEKVQAIGIVISGLDKEMVTVSCVIEEIFPAIEKSAEGALCITSHIPKPKPKAKKEAPAQDPAAQAPQPQGSQPDDIMGVPGIYAPAEGYATPPPQKNPKNQKEKMQSIAK